MTTQKVPYLASLCPQILAGAMFYGLRNHNVTLYFGGTYCKILMYGKWPKISYTKEVDKMEYANSTDPDQTAPGEQSDQGLHCLPFH